MSLLDAFSVEVDDVSVSLPMNAQRLIAYLGLRRHPQPRSIVAGTLWLDVPERRATANLRTALWRTRQQASYLIDATPALLQMGSDVDVDVDRMIDQARRIVAPAGHLEDDDYDPTLLAGELLPDWDIDWVIIERERLHQLRLHALEALAERLARLGRYGEAVEAGLAAVRAEPLRESAQRSLIEVYLLEGNVSDAVRQYRRYRELLFDALAINPSESMRRLIAPCHGPV